MIRDALDVIIVGSSGLNSQQKISIVLIHL